MTMTETMTPEQRRKNVLLAWILAGLALFMLLSSVPFWKGLVHMLALSGQ